MTLCKDMIASEITIFTYPVHLNGRELSLLSENLSGSITTVQLQFNYHSSGTRVVC